jgi:ribosome biogenesis GTPase
MKKRKNISGPDKRGDRPAEAPSATGRVIEEQKNYFVVDTPDGTVMATTAGVLKKVRSRVCAGDIVQVTVIDTSPPARGVITAIHPRTHHLRRPALANCSHLLCVCTFREPSLNLEALDRLLFCAHAFEMTPCIVFNKSDLVGSDDRDVASVVDQYAGAGYQVFVTSASRGEGIGALIDFCSDRLCACAGLSGVGKSSLLSAMFPGRAFRIGAVSGTDGRGTHTTTSVTLHALPNGGYIADTPGLALVDLPQMHEDNVILHFPEIARCIGQCRFNNCTHDNEPGCSVCEKIECGEISPWRREHYLKIRAEMAQRRKSYR